jgi:preprotein translocase subunit YajC
VRWHSPEALFNACLSSPPPDAGAGERRSVGRIIKMGVIGQVGELVLLGAAPPPGEGAPGGALSNPLIPMAMIFLLVYFMVIRPARRRQKALQEMIGNLNRGDKVITNGGIHGIVVGLSDHIVQLRVADQVTLDVSRSAIAGLQPREEEQG